MSADVEHLVHGTLVGFAGSGVLLTGPSGSGKSDLALRLIDTPGLGLGNVLAAARLVADDQVLVHAEGDQVVGRPPPALAGRLEVRGIGIVSVPYMASCPIALVVELVTDSALDRMPEPTRSTLCGISLPSARLAAFEVSATAKLRAMMAVLTSDLRSGEIHKAK